MTYQAARTKIESTPQFSSTATLSRIRLLLGLLKNPEKQLKIIHIAGTNGKGSTSTMTARILEEHGYQTGLFLSPYVTTFRERVSINGIFISKQDFAIYAERVLTASEQLEDRPNFFELMTALCLLYFAESGCEFAVLEVGMGGRLDATNAIPAPLVAAITPIALDHTKYLGDTTAKIAHEKCGIIKPGCIAVSSLGQPHDSMQEIKAICSSQNIPLIVPEPAEDIICTMEYTAFHHRGLNYRLQLLGEHQAENACTTLAICDALKQQGVPLIADKCRLAMEKATLPARLERISDRPLCLLDGGHNPHGIAKLFEFVAKNRTDGRLICVFGCLKDKGFSEMCNTVAKESDILITTPCPSPRSCAPTDLDPYLSACEERYQMQNCESALKKAHALANANDVIVICGSLYLASEVKRLTLRQNI